MGESPEREFFQTTSHTPALPFPFLSSHPLSTRLLPAFSSGTPIPYAWVNLRRGVLPDDVTHTCTAGAGTLLLEFSALSNLSGIPIFQCSVTEGPAGSHTHVLGDLSLLRCGHCWRRPKPDDVTHTCNAGAGTLLLEFSVLSNLSGIPIFQGHKPHVHCWCRHAAAGVHCAVEPVRHSHRPVETCQLNRYNYLEARTGKARTGEACTGEARTGEACTGEARTGEACTGEARTGEACTGEARTGEARTGEARTGETRTGKTCSG
ncbi:unnamed protein product [Closterium sp. NIES-54]